MTRTILKPNKTYSYPDMVLLSLKTSPLHTILFAARQITDALIPTITIFVTAYFIDTAIAIFNGYAALPDIYLPIALIFGIMAYNMLMNSIMDLINANRVILYRKRLVPEMANYRASLAYRYIEDPKSHDLIFRVFPYIEDRVWNLFTQVLQIVSLIVFVLGIVITLFTQVWWIAITMVLTSIPIMYIATKAGKERYQADKDMTEIDRIQWNLSWILIDRENVEERAVYGYSNDINDRYNEKFEYARNYRLKITIKNTIKQKLGGIITSLYAIGAIVALLPQTYSGIISIGMFIALIGAVISLSQRLSWGVNSLVFEMTRNSEWLKDLTQFMALEMQSGATDAPALMDFKKIEFKNVKFTYPGTDKTVLNGVSFTIEKGRHYSFVGENGAGKTTITKLITGLYNNYEGDILVDNVNLRDIHHSKLKGLTSVVFQDFARYSITLYDNIAMGDIQNHENRKKVEEAVDLVGLSEAVKNLKHGLDTPLGKVMEDGVDLSGGQWQRTAMARSVINPAPLKILDEPTAALDPVAESTVYKNFEKITKGETTIFISHRLGSTKLADTIFVLSDGKIAEQGSHTELMQKNGIYNEMFTTQAQWYVEE